MRLNALVVCVGYADLFSRSISRWASACDRIICVTTPGDAPTHELCGSQGVEVFTTDLFTADGADFNKGRALAAAATATGWRDADWLLAFDADIVPPENWRDEVDKAEPGRLYGAPRHQVAEDGPLNIEGARKMPHSQPQGYFSLFHANDPCVPADPIFDCTLRHAGWYDVVFANNWPRDRWRELPIDLIHLGAPCENWLGRERKQECWEMLRHRDRYQERLLR